MQKESGNKPKFVPRVLPWLLGGVALTGYLLTLNPWVSFFNVPQVAKMCGWNWTPDLNGPAFYVVTLPLRLLPVKWVPLVLNLFSALCAALALVQLARSVALLPHDRTHEQRSRETSEHATLSISLAWLPPLFAVLVCALQLTFWENATNGTSEMFDLLLFSWVIRSLLEYRLDRRESRLLHTAFIYGIAMTNNFAMIGFFPAFIAALVWIRGLAFFNLGFLSRMAIFGLAGLSLYILLPLLAMFHSLEPVGFWTALKINLGSQLATVFQPGRMLSITYKTVATIGLTTLLPVLILSIRWASYFGDSSRLGNTLATLMFHIVHVGFLVASLWIYFDPPFGPRLSGGGLSFLTFFYMGALGIGYFSGYCLLVFRPNDSRGRLVSPMLKPVNALAKGLVFALLILVPCGLITRNLPQIRATNGPAIEQFAASLARELPQSAALLNDEPEPFRTPYRLLILRSWLARDGRDRNYLFLNTQYLHWPAYHRYLHKTYPKKWDAPPSGEKETVPVPALISRLIELSKDTDLYYLHPSFGYYFEVFYPQPKGLLVEMKAYKPGTLFPPKLTPQTIAENESFWMAETNLTIKTILSAASLRASEDNPSTLDKVFKALHVPRERNVQGSVLGSYYSRSLNCWGVEMQKLEDLEKAAVYFNLALKVNPDNVVALVNSEYNKNLRAGIAAPVTITKSIEENLGRFRSWDQAVNANGPYDEPSLSYAQAYIYIQARYYRQAAQNLERVRRFSPDNLQSRIALSQVHLLANLPDTTLALTEEIRKEPGNSVLTKTNLTDLAAIEASAWFVKREPEKARAILDAAINKNPTDDYLLAAATGVYTRSGDYTNALATVEQRVKLRPDDTDVLSSKASICMLMGDFNSAIDTLNRALSIEPKNDIALLNRAISFLQLGRLDKAEVDYENLNKSHTNQFKIIYGLGEIAWQRKDTNTAIRHYQTYLTNAPPNTAEAKLVADRLGQLKKGKKPK